MTTIPDDIREQAMRIASSGKDLAVIRIGIIQALMDERERCALIAEAVTRESARDREIFITTGVVGLGRSIAAAIRSQTP